MLKFIRLTIKVIAILFIFLNFFFAEPFSYTIVDETHSQDPELSPKVTPRESASQKNDDSKLPTPRLVVVTPRDGQVEKSDKSLNSSTSNLKAKDPSPRKSRTDTEKLLSTENTKEKSPRRSHRDSIGSPREDFSPKSEPLLRHRFSFD